MSNSQINVITKKVWIALSLSLLLGACGKVSDKYGEQTQINIDKNNKDLSAKVAAAEADLARLHRYYQGTAGTYEGFAEISTANKIRVRLTLVPTVFPYKGERERTLEEVTSDINKLAFQLVYSLNELNGSISYTSCKSDEIFADHEMGKLNLISSCPLSLAIYSTFESLETGELSAVAVLSQKTAKSLLNGEISKSQFMTIDAQSQVGEVRFWTHLRKIDQ